MISEARQIFEQSDGAVTKRYYDRLTAMGPLGLVALNLFRAQKTSTRAKKYSPKYKRMSYDVKAWSMGQLCNVLMKHGEQLQIPYGWKLDPETVFGLLPSWVLYVDTPCGQVSFHSPSRGEGPDYPGEYDGLKLSEKRILQFCDHVTSDTLVSA